MGDKKKKHKKDSKSKKRKRDKDSSKKDKKKDKKDKKRHRTSEEDRERKLEKKRLKEAKKMLKKAAKKKPGEIDETDYFAKSVEFKVWLRKEKNIFMDELETKKSKEYFKKFIKKWNKKKLDDKYYKGIDRSSFDAEASRTRHQWSFKLDSKDEKKLQNCRDTVDTETFSTKKNMFDGIHQRDMNADDAQPNESSSSSSNRKRKAAVQEDTEENDAERRERIFQERKKQRLENKQWKKHNKSVMEELVPKPDPGSFAARVEKRKKKGAYAKKGDESPEMRDDDLMGGRGSGGPSMNDFQRMVGAKRAKKQRYDAKMQKKLDAHQEKEAGIMARMRALMEQNQHKYKKT